MCTVMSCLHLVEPPEPRLASRRVRAQAMAAVSALLPAPAGKSLVDTAAQYLAAFPGDSCVISVLHETCQSLHAIAVGHGQPAALRVLNALLVADESSLVDAFSRRVVQSGTSLSMPRVTTEMMRLWTRPPYWPYLECYGAHSVIAAPLRAPRARIMGAISVWRQDGSSAHGSESEAFLSAFAGRLAYALGVSLRRAPRRL